MVHGSSDTFHSASSSDTVHGASDIADLTDEEKLRGFMLSIGCTAKQMNTLECLLKG
jgi:hypothetical protein